MDATRAKKLLKDISPSDSGHYYFDTHKGYLIPEDLREIADLLDLINEPLDKELEQYFKDQDINEKT